MLSETRSWEKNAFDMKKKESTAGTPKEAIEEQKAACCGAESTCC